MAERPSIRAPKAREGECKLITDHLPPFLHGLSLPIKQGFYAKPQKSADGTLNMMIWEVGVPGKPQVGPVKRAMCCSTCAVSWWVFQELIWW